MRGPKKLQPMAKTNIQTDGHGDSTTESAQWGRFSEKHQVNMLGKQIFSLKGLYLHLIYKVHLKAVFLCVKYYANQALENLLAVIGAAWQS